MSYVWGVYNLSIQGYPWNYTSLAYQYKIIIPLHNRVVKCLCVYVCVCMYVAFQCHFALCQSFAFNLFDCLISVATCQILFIFES